MGNSKRKTYQPSPVREHLIPKAGQKDKYRKLGIPTVYDRVCQQAIKNRLEPIFEEGFDEANFGYRPMRSTHDAVDKVTQELQDGHEWIVDADLKDFFTTVDHGKLMELLNQRVSDGRVLGLVESILKAGVQGRAGHRPTEQGTPQGGVISPLLSNVILTPFDKEMRKRGYRLTRYADDWRITCRTRDEAARALHVARQILAKLGVTLNQDKTRIRPDSVETGESQWSEGQKVRDKTLLRLIGSYLRAGTMENGKKSARARWVSLREVL